MVGKTISHYKIVQKLGQGGMGVVYKALDTRLQRLVAIKMLTPEFASDEKRKKRLIAEARAASALNHPNICTIHEIDEADGMLFIVMEYVEGKPLHETISQGPLDSNEALKFAIQIGEALQNAHDHSIVHRDIKPSNILVTQEGRAKILDFGLAQVVREIEEAALSQASTMEEKITQTGVIVGTIHYMSPEQISGRKVDARSDIFSFGIVLYQMLTGTLPFKGDSVFEIMSSILTAEPEPLSQRNSNISLALERIAAKTLAKKVDDRYFSMKQVLSDLKNMPDGESEKMSGRGRESSVAVLYFENLSAAKDEEYFRDGMTEDVITELSKIKDLKVFARSAVLAFRDKPATIREVGEQVSASHILTGSLRRSGKRVRVTAQLVEARSGHSIWAERYDRELEDVFELQDEIARSIADALRITLTPQEEKAIARNPTENAQAYDYYLRGRNYTRRATESDLEYAMQMYDHAVLLEPGFALAYAGIANVCSLFYHWFGEDSTWIEKAIFACDRALALQPELPEALSARAYIFLVQENYDASIRYALKAIQSKRDCEGAYWNLGRAYFYKNQWKDAAAIAVQAIEASGDDYNVYVPYIAALEHLGETELVEELRWKHIQALQQQLDWVPEDARARSLLAGNYAKGGRNEDSIRELEKAISLRPEDPSILYNAACTYALLEKKDQALQCLEQAIAVGFRNVGWAERDLDLACVHDDPRFHALMAELRKFAPKS